jgi:hypothetical protein
VRYFLRLAAIILCAAGVSGVIKPTDAVAQVFTEATKPATKKPSTRAPATAPTRRTRGARETARVTAPTPPPPPTFSEPEAYCAANPDANGPGPDFVSGIPYWVTNGWKLASNSTQPISPSAMKWKCSSGRVLACGSMVGEDFCSKPDNLTETTQEMITYCADKRKGAIPREITGNTLSVWVCKNRKPVLSGYRTDVDANGYLSGTWLDVTPFSPANMVGDVPRAYSAKWAVPVKVGLLGSMIRSGSLTSSYNPNNFVTTFSAMQIDGGQLGTVVGTNVYYGESPGQQIAPSGCEAKLILTEMTATSITLTERYVSQPSNCRKPETFKLQARDGQLLVNWMVKGKTKPKRSEWVQAFQ